MNCDICHEYLQTLSHHSNLEISAKGGRLKIHDICEVCAEKIEDFLKSLGWRLTK